jgi:hypothetical protein
MLMVAWPRLVSHPLGALALSAALVTAAHAQPVTPADAARLADEGKGLSAEGKDAEASEKFRQAIVISPEGKFYWYLCVSLSKEGKLGEALNACDAVERNGADEKTVAKQRAMTQSLRDEMKKRNMDPDKALEEGRKQPEPEATGGGASGEGGGSSAVAVPAAMPQYTTQLPPSVYTIQTLPHEYTWSVGLDFFGAGMTIGDPDAYESAGAGFRIRGDLLLSKSQRIGAQAYLGATYVTAKSDFEEDDLTVADFGLAGFKHFCFGRLCVTPLVGAHFSGISPGDGTDDAMAAVGARLEGTVALALGSRYEHVLSGQLGLNAYSPAIGDYSLDPEVFGLDEASSSVYLGVGYTYRFNTPLGASPLITFD